MAATAKNIQASYEKIKTTPKCAVLVPFIEPAIALGQQPGGDMDWVVSWTAFEKMADDAHVANLIPGALGKKYTQLYSDQTKVDAPAEPVAITDEMLETAPPIAEDNSPTVGTPGPDLSDVPTGDPEMAKVAQYEEVAEPDVAQQETPEEVAFVAEAKAGDEIQIQSVTGLIEGGTYFPLGGADLAVMVAVASEFQSADNVPYQVTGDGIAVLDENRPKVLKLFMHLSEHSERITSVPSRELVVSACKSVLEALQEGNNDG